MPNNNRFIWVTLIAFFGISAAFVFGIVVFGKVDSNSTPLITTVLGFASLTVITLLNIASNQKTNTTTNRIEQKVDEVQEKTDSILNGEMEEKIRGVFTDMLSRHEQQNP